MIRRKNTSRILLCACLIALCHHASASDWILYKMYKDTRPNEIMFVFGNYGECAAARDKMMRDNPRFGFFCTAKQG